MNSAVQRSYKLKKILSLIAGILILLCAASPIVMAHAEGIDIHTATTYEINPLYRDVVTREDLAYIPRENPAGETGRKSAASIPLPVLIDNEKYYKLEEGVEFLRKAMEERKSEVTVCYYAAGAATESSAVQLSRKTIEMSFQHTGKPTQGDYIRWQYGGYESTIQYYTIGDVGYYHIAYRLLYFTDRQQEDAVTAAVEELIDSLHLKSGTRYEAIKAVYDYICSNIVYDHDNTKEIFSHTAYSAIITKKTVCQGYALLLYRLLLEIGIDNQIVVGNNTRHGWNVIRLGNVYYYADSTWDAGRRNYAYFLRGADDFSGHTADETYPNGKPQTVYPMSPTAYVSVEQNHTEHEFSDYADDHNESCVKDGTMTRNCLYCFENEVIQKQGSMLHHTCLVPVHEEYHPATYTTYGSYKEVEYCYYCGFKMRSATCQEAKKVLPATTISSAKSVSSKKITVKWEAVPEASGYQLRYKLGSKSQTITVGKSILKKTIGNLKKGKTYSLSVRAIRKENGKTAYAKWSKVKKVRVK